LGSFELIRGVVRCDPRREVGQLLRKRRVDLGQLGSELIALGDGRVVGDAAPDLVLLPAHLASAARPAGERPPPWAAK
jgi:hypothetical protein